MASRGGTGQTVLGLTVVLPDGTLLRTNAGGSNVHRLQSVVPSTDGPTLTPLFIGDGGLLGIKVEATMQLLPAAPHADAGSWSFDDFDAAWTALVELTSFRELPYSTLTVSEHPPWSVTFGVRTADRSAVAPRMQVIRKTLASHGGRAGDEEHDAHARQALVGDREWMRRSAEADRAIVAFVFGKRAFPGAYARVRALLDERVAQDAGLQLSAYFCPYARNAVYAVLSIGYDAGRQGSRRRAAETATDAYRLITELGGHSEPHQGVAAEIAAGAWSPEVRSLVESIKHAVDPRSTLNRGLWGLALGHPER
jgi:FAD/FMN-containing dehydrogenase